MISFLNFLKQTNRCQLFISIPNTTAHIIIHRCTYIYHLLTDSNGFEQYNKPYQNFFTTNKLIVAGTRNILCAFRKQQFFFNIFIYYEIHTETHAAQFQFTQYNYQIQASEFLTNKIKLSIRFPPKYKFGSAHIFVDHQISLRRLYISFCENSIKKQISRN